MLCEPTPRGILKSLCATRGRLVDVCGSWNEIIRDAFRIFLLDTILTKVENLSTEEIEFLQMIPIFEKYQTQSSHPDRLFCPLKSNAGVLLLIPPRNISNELLNDHFVKIRNDKDRSLYSMMGLQEPSSIEFYCLDVLPSISKNVYSDSTLSLLSVELLRILPSLESQDSGLTTQLRSCPFVKNAKGLFSRPDMLYDPHAPYLPSILPFDAFPCPKLYQDGSLLSSLRTIGLCTTLTVTGIIRAAESIHHDYSSEYVEEKPERNEKIQRALQRSINLFRYLDLNIENLNSNAENSDWTIKLRDLAWVPVWTDPPSSCRIATFDPPWPPAMHRSPLARPTQSYLTESTWLCSTTHRIVKFEPQSESLVKLLGWNMNVSGRSATSQLLSLIDMHAACQTPERFAEVCYQVIPRLYSTLSSSLESESDVEVEIWSRSLKGKPFVWISGMFVEPNRISFTPLSSINTEPYLFVAKGELISYRPLLLQLGVKEAFGVTDLLALLRDLSSIYGVHALPSEKLDMCLGIVKIIVQILSDEPKSIDSDDDSDENAEEESKALNKMEHVMKIRETLGDVYLPDRNNILVSSKALSYDDAPWISSQLSSRGIRFVHRLIDNEAALLLGAHSLREQLFSGDAIVCPDSGMVRDIIGTDSVDDSIGDLVGLADKLGCSAVHLVLDEVTHPSESLIHPGLGLAQGPAILVLLEGITVSVEELTQLMLSPNHVLDPSLNQRNAQISADATECNYNSVGKRLHSAFAITDCLQVLSGNQFYVFDPCGTFLIGSGEEREAVSGRSKTSTSARPQSKAQRYALNGKDNQSMLTRFPDQFEGFFPPLIDSLRSFKDASVNSTIFRLPLRSEPSVISSNIYTSESIGQTLKNLVSRIEGSLIFSHFLQVTTLQRCQAISSQEEKCSSEALEIRLRDAPNIHSLRRKIIGDASWKKSGGLFLWKQPVLAVESTYRATIVCRYMRQGEILPLLGNEESLPNVESKTPENRLISFEWRTDWIVRCLQGVEANRTMALKDPFKRLELQPFVSLAAPILSPAQLQSALITQDASKFCRYIYCNSGCLGGGPTGFPFHIEGSFVMVQNSFIL